MNNSEMLKEQGKKEKQVQENIITDNNVKTVDNLKQEYEDVLDENDGIVVARKLEKKEVPYALHLKDDTTAKKTKNDYVNISEDIFFKDGRGVVTLIPELSEIEEGDIEGNYYKSSKCLEYSSSRKGSHAFDIHEWGFSVNDSENVGQIDAYDKYYRYVTLNDLQKVVKVFESNHRIDEPWGNLYHRNRDENGKLCIRLVDLAGNIHFIKENGKVGEKGLKERTYGPKRIYGSRGDYQLKVVYKDNEPVYALFMNDCLTNNQNEFCTTTELREFYEKQKKEFQKHGVYIDKTSCFANIEEIIESFNETFMKGDFVPSLDKTKVTKEDKSVTELSEELSRLTEKEKQAKQLLDQYEHQLYNTDKEI